MNMDAKINLEFRGETRLLEFSKATVTTVVFAGLN